MTHPGGQPGTGPNGPGGTGPPKPVPPKLTAAAILAAIDDDVIRIAASLPPPSPSVMAKVADIFRRSWRLGQLDKAA